VGKGGHGISALARCVFRRAHAKLRNVDDIAAKRDRVGTAEPASRIH